MVLQGRRARWQARACVTARQAGYRICVATEADVAEVAELCAQVKDILFTLFIAVVMYTPVPIVPIHLYLLYDCRLIGL